jgi:hypothetical protein
MNLSTNAQKRAIKAYRTRLVGRGVARFEIQARESDRELIRALARRLAGGGSEAELARAIVRQIVVGEVAAPGGVLAALRRSPLVGADLDLGRPREAGRRVGL